MNPSDRSSLPSEPPPSPPPASGRRPDIQMEFDDKARPTHRLSLTVATSSVDEWSAVHNFLSRMAAEWGPYHEQVSVSSVMLDAQGVPMVQESGETYTEETLFKVRATIINVIRQRLGYMERADDQTKLAIQIINALQNAGILFRERV